MIKIIVWILLIGVLILFAKRLSRVLVVTIVFIFSVFSAIFLLDTFTVLDLRSHLPFMQKYDETLDDPKKVATDVKEKVYGTGEGAIKRINIKADELDKQYGTETDSQIEKREKEKLEAENKEKLEAENSTEISEEDTVAEESNKEEVVENSSEEGKLYEETTSKHFIKYQDFHDVMSKEYPNISEHDYQLAYSVTDNLLVDFNGESYRIWNEADKPNGFYIQKLK